MADAADHIEVAIRRGLSDYDIGQKLKKLRRSRGLSLAQLGSHTQLSPSMLSQLETGKLIPTLPTLAQIALTLNVGLNHFFESKKSQRLFEISRAADRAQHPSGLDAPAPGHAYEVLSPRMSGTLLSPYLVTFGAVAPDHPSEHTHEGSEFVFVLEGSIAITYAGQEHGIGTGGSAYFDPSSPHSYRKSCEGEAKVLLVTAPPGIWRPMPAIEFR